MTIELIRQLRNAHPFRPFRLVLNDRRSLLVSRPEKIGWSPDGRVLGVYEKGDSNIFIEIDEIVKVQPSGRRNSKNGRR